MAANDKQLYERDPEAWNAYLAEGNARQARKRVAADVILRDEDGRFLLVNPNYKPDWDLPGGMVEANEAPIDAARRELREELGLDIPVGAAPVRRVGPAARPWDDTLVFIFDGGVLAARDDPAPHDHRRRDLRLPLLHKRRGARAAAPVRVAALLAALGALETGRAQYRHRDDEPD